MRLMAATIFFEVAVCLVAAVFRSCRASDGSSNGFEDAMRLMAAAAIFRGCGEVVRGCSEVICGCSEVVRGCNKVHQVGWLQDCAS